MSGNHRSGRPRKSDDEHRLTGTFRKDRHGEIGTLKIEGAVVRPRSLTGESREYWDKTITPLVEAGVVQKTDVPAATRLCQFWVLCGKSIELAMKDPTDKVLRTAVTGYQAEYDSLAARFGLTPVDRRKLPVKLKANERPKVATRKIAGRINPESA